MYPPLKTYRYTVALWTDVPWCPSVCWHCVTVAESLSYLKEKGVAAFPLLLKLKASISKKKELKKEQGV